MEPPLFKEDKRYLLHRKGFYIIPIKYDYKKGYPNPGEPPDNI